MITNEESIEIVNLMTPGAVILVLGCGGEGDPRGES